MEKQEYLTNLFESLDKELAEFDLTFVNNNTNEITDLRKNIPIDFDYNGQKAIKSEFNYTAAFEYFKAIYEEDLSWLVNKENFDFFESYELDEQEANKFKEYAVKYTILLNSKTASYYAYKYSKIILPKLMFSIFLSIIKCFSPKKLIFPKDLNKLIDKNSLKNIDFDEFENKLDVLSLTRKKDVEEVIIKPTRDIIYSVFEDKIYKGKAPKEKIEQGILESYYEFYPTIKEIKKEYKKRTPFRFSIWLETQPYYLREIYKDIKDYLRECGAILTCRYLIKQYDLGIEPETLFKKISKYKKLNEHLNSNTKRLS